MCDLLTPTVNPHNMILDNVSSICHPYSYCYCFAVCDHFIIIIWLYASWCKGSKAVTGIYGTFAWSWKWWFSVSELWILSFFLLSELWILGVFLLSELYIQAELTVQDTACFPSVVAVISLCRASSNPVWDLTLPAIWPSQRNSAGHSSTRRVLPDIVKVVGCLPVERQKPDHWYPGSGSQCLKLKDFFSQIIKAQTPCGV